MPHTLWQFLVGTHPTHLGFEWVECLDEGVKQPEPAEDAEDVLQRDTPFPGLEPPDRGRSDARALGQLLLREPAQTAPRSKVLSRTAQRATNGQRSGGMRVRRHHRTPQRSTQDHLNRQI